MRRAGQSLPPTMVLTLDRRADVEASPGWRMPTRSRSAARLINVSELAAPFQITRPTIRDYVTLLERIFILEELPPWHRPIRRRGHRGIRRRDVRGPDRRTVALIPK